jgi:hypothetical protein
VKGRRRPSAGLGFETFGTAVGFALVSGALSLVDPTLTVVPGTLAALAVAAWAVGRKRSGTRALPRPTLPSWGPVAVLAVAGTLYLDPGAPWGPFRGLALGLGLVPLWWTERHRPSVVPGGP